MTAKPIKRLLEAKPFVQFTLHIGSLDNLVIDDPHRCRLDEAESVLYVEYPEFEPPAAFSQFGEPSSITIVDLRHVAQVSVGVTKMTV